MVLSQLFQSFAVVCQWEISVYISKLIFHLIVTIQWDICLHKESDNSQCSTPHTDLIIIQCVPSVHLCIVFQAALQVGFWSILEMLLQFFWM